MKSLLEQMAEALLARDALRLRELVLDWGRLKGSDSLFAAPVPGDRRVRIAAAALAELLSERARLKPPAWAQETGSFAEPFFALSAASRLKSVKALCEQETPEPFRRHGIFAPANFLNLV